MNRSFESVGKECLSISCSHLTLSLSLNARNFLISEPVLLLLFTLFYIFISISISIHIYNKVKYRVQNIAFPSSQNKEPSVLEYSPLIWEHKLDIGGMLDGHSTVSQALLFLPVWPSGKALGW